MRADAPARSTSPFTVSLFSVNPPPYFGAACPFTVNPFSVNPAGKLKRR